MENLFNIAVSSSGLNPSGMDRWEWAYCKNNMHYPRWVCICTLQCYTKLQKSETEYDQILCFLHQKKLLYSKKSWNKLFQYALPEILLLSTHWPEHLHQCNCQNCCNILRKKITLVRILQFFSFESLLISK